MKVVLTAQAKADLQGIGRWIAQDNPARAVSFVQELQRKAYELTSPQGPYPVITNAGFVPAVHRINYKGYRIAYRVIKADGIVEILFIHLGARAYPPLP